jgi:hypothetical protein
MDTVDELDELDGSHVDKTDSSVKTTGVISLPGEVTQCSS